MIELLHEPLARHTSIRIGGILDRLMIPESREEMMGLLRHGGEGQKPLFVMGRGSNLLVKDGRIRGWAIKNTAACCELQVDGNKMHVGSSVSLQRFIDTCIAAELGGLEYLYSVPGNIGGAICMNAGRGKRHKQSIADFVVSVQAFNGRVLKTFKQEECGFAFRTSRFQKGSWVILAADFALHRQVREVGERKRQERLDLVKQQHDLAYPNLGSIFREGFNPLDDVIGHRIGAAEFSRKTPGWIINTGGATFQDVNALIRYARRCHRRQRLARPQLEVCIVPQNRWDRLVGSYD